MMKYTLPLLLLIAASTACNDAEQHRTAIESLTTSWMDVQKELDELYITFGKEQGNWSYSYEKLVITPDIRAQIPEADQDIADGLTYESKMQGEAINGLLAAVEMEKAKVVNLKADVEALQNGLANGKMPPNYQEAMQKVTDQILQTRNNMVAWSQQLEAGKSAYQTNHDELKRILDNVKE